MKTSRPVAVIATLLLLGAACGGGSDGGGGGAGAGSGEAKGFDDVTLATVGNMMHLPEYVAVERGFWAEHGLNVKLDILADGADVNKALQSGTAEFGSASTTSVPAARSAGLPQKLVAPGMNDATSSTYAGPLGIVGRKDQGITEDPSSLVGKKVAVHEGSTNHEYFLLYLQEHGIDPNQVDIVPIEAQDQPVSLEQGDIDAASDWEPFVSQMSMEQGDNAVLLSQNDPLLGYTIGVGATDDVIKEEADIMEKFSQGIAQASYWIRQNPEEAAEVATNFISGLETEYAVAAMDNLAFDPRISSCTEQSFETAAEGLAKKGEIDTAPPGPEMMDGTIMEKVEEENPEWFEDLPPLPQDCQ
ncbi:MAG: ABC transporter substrate-binding protein [Actinomycetota bacterium]